MKLMHKLYKIISYVLIPIIKINTFIRVLKKKEDKIRFKERFGFTNLQKPLGKELIWIHASSVCLLYTSDAADDTPCVDLGGRRII